MAEWVRANEAHLDRLCEATMRPRFYSPPPNLLAKRDDAVVSTELSIDGSFGHETRHG